MFRRLRLLLLVCALFVPLPAHGAETVERLGDAHISRDNEADSWTIGAGGAALTLTLHSQRDFTLAAITSPTGRNWMLRPQADSITTVNGSTIPLGSRTQGFQFDKVTTSNDGNVLRLDAIFIFRPANLWVTRHFVVASGSPSFEVWTTFQSMGSEIVSVSNLNAFQLTLPPGTIHWLTGRQGDPNDDVRDTAFELRQQTVAIGQTLTLGAQNRSSEQTVPWFALDGEQDEFYAGLMWSGAWSLEANRGPAGMAVSLGLGHMTTTVGSVAVDGPHAVFGVARGTLSEATAALRSYVLNGIRGGRALVPLVTYNTWFTYGTSVDEASMRSAIEYAASLGAEVFVIDAGWYTGADTVDRADFDTGLGTWEVDPSRFPNGMRALTDYAHSFGLKFGIWVEPERVNLSVVGDGGVDERWLATTGGNYGSDHAAQICLAGEAGRKWVLDRLTSLIDEVQPDYLKWDNNMWTNCDRAGHGHGPSDGSFEHVTALYQMLETIRQRYPNLLIENCAGGANRIDFGMLRYSDAAWMDDRTAPSVHVRHNIEGLSAAFPPAYLLSFVTDHDREPLRSAPDLSLYFRSRMGGALGLCFWDFGFSASELAEIVREIAIYKEVRTTLSVAAAALLSPQANEENAPDWDVMQATAPGNDALVIYAYQNAVGAEKVTVKPTGLQPGVMYDVSSVDVGFLGSASGADLMTNGIDVVESKATAAHILQLVADPN